MLKTLLLVHFRGEKRFLIFDFVIFHQVFARFSNFTKFSPKKKMVNSPGFFTRSFTRFWKFTKFNPNFTVKHINFTKKNGKTLLLVKFGGVKRFFVFFW